MSGDILGDYNEEQLLVYCGGAAEHSSTYRTAFQTKEFSFHPQCQHWQP
jgi:hypothetical protein